MSHVWSYSSLDTFEQCPRKFYHRYILKEKEPSSPAPEKGNAMHKACENYLLGKGPQPQYALVEPVKRQAVGKKLMVEAKLGLNGALEPSGFFDDRVWGRIAVDVLILDYPNAVVVDWKSGKVQEGAKWWKGPKQLQILAMFVLKHFPKIERVTALNIYLEHDKAGEAFVFTRAQEAAMWAQLLPAIERMENAIRSNSFCMMPGPLCGFCSVKSCPNNRS